MTIAYKWLGDKKVTTLSLPNYPGFSKNHKCDRALCRDAIRILDEADIIVAHNGKKFDAKWLTARFLKHNLRPPSPYKIFDTLTEHRKLAAAPSHKLDDLGGIYGLGRKRPTTGKKLWLDCRAGKRSAFRKMARYNAQDVILLERLYLHIRPWSKHPDLRLLSRAANSCPVCESNHTIFRGWHYYATGKKQRSLCKDCGHRFILGKHHPLERV